MVRSPSYMSRFQCVGGACEETCCTDFHVDVDEATFRRYQAVDDPALAEKLKALVRPRGAEATAEGYARIAMTAAGECPFLDGQRLCSIQGALGEEALSHTCRTFPRAAWTRDGVAHLAGKLSCPEAARLCVSDAGAMDVEGAPAPAVSSARAAVHAAVERAARDPDLPVWKALVLAGRLVDAALPDDRAAGAAGEDAVRVVEAEAERLGRALAGLGAPSDGESLLQLQLLIQVALAASAKCNAARNRFPHLAQAALGAIFDGAEDFEGALANYRRLYKERFKPFDDRHDHALRNWLLNYLLINQSFLAGPALPQHQNLVVRYGVMRLLLVGLSGLRPEGLTLADYGAVVSASSRILDHDAALSPEICKMVEGAGLRSAALAAQLAVPPA